MASICQWISVLRSPTSDGNLTVTINSRNNSAEIEIPVSVPVLHIDDPKTTARKFAKAINTSLGDRLYNGCPDFDDQQKTFRLRAIQVDHLVNIWSQSEFDLKVAAETGVYAGASPVYATLKDLDRFGMGVGVSVKSESGGCLPEEEQIGVLQIGSFELMALLENETLVATQYLHEESGNWFRGWNFERYPVISYDQPWYGDVITGIYPLETSFTVDHADGVVRIETIETPCIQRGSRTPIDLKQTYVAGFSHVPEILKIESIRMIKRAQRGSEVASIKRGTGSITFVDNQDYVDQLRSKLGLI